MFRPTGPSDWLLSFVETRRELYTGMEVWGYHIVRHAAAVCGDAHLIQAALRELIDRKVLKQVRYMPHMPDPILPPGNTSIWHNNQYSGPMWKWTYTVASNWREIMNLPLKAST